MELIRNAMERVTPKVEAIPEVGDVAPTAEEEGSAEAATAVPAGTAGTAGEGVAGPAGEKGGEGAAPEPGDADEVSSSPVDPSFRAP